MNANIRSRMSNIPTVQLLRLSYINSMRAKAEKSNSIAARSFSLIMVFMEINYDLTF